MTLGERIQALRKEAGLSQEELGEKLGVARQSVSKWESDATIPELDKLITMSKLFGISVGGLLGIEESEGADHELTDRELAALEAIAKKLAQAQARPEGPKQEEPPKKRRRWGRVALALVLLVGGLMLMSRINSLENQLGNLQYNMSNIQNTVSREIGSISSQVRDILEEQNSVTAGKDYQILEMDLLKNEVTFSLTATPREYREGMTAVFSAAGPDFEAVAVPGTLGAGQTFRAQLTCPITDDITLSVGFVADGTTVTQQLGQERYLWSNTQVEVEGSLGWSISGTGAELKLSALSADVWHVFTAEFKTAQGWQEISVAKGTFRLWKGEELIWSQECEELPRRSYGNGITIPVEGLALSPGERLTLSLLYTDSAGREAEAYLDGLWINEDGRPGRVAPYEVEEGWSCPWESE